MELKIYDKQGNVKMTVSPDNSSQWNHEVGVENVVTVNFTTWEFLVLEVGWYILVEGHRFSIKSEYRPKHIHDTKYTYNLKFYGREHDTQDILFCRLNQGEDDLESVFAYDGTPMDFLQKVVANMNRNTDGVVWKAGEAISANRQTINFNGLYCWDALGEIARAFGTEWWLDGEYVNLSKCIRGESVSLGYGEGLKSGLTQNENTNAVKWFTRLIPVGSTKNIDKSKYGYANLQLPGREKYIDINTQYGLKEYREEAAFSEIYPHRVGTISSVRSEERTNEETGNYTVYYVKDSSLPFNPDEYMIGGEVIHMTFNSGALAGKDFEVNWNNDTSEFEIINQYPDDITQLPGSNLIPSSGDQYVLSNISMPDEYNRAAEEEYQQAVDAFLEEYSKDVSIYSGNTDYIYVAKNNVPLLLGQRIRLLSDQYFDEGTRDSRITRVSRKLNNLGDASIDCSNAIASSWKSGVDSSLNQLQFSVAKVLAESVIEILKTSDIGNPSDYNVLSSLRSLNTFLRKDKDDTAKGVITFENQIKSHDFAQGNLMGAGWSIYRDGNGNVVVETDRMIIRKDLSVSELIVNQETFQKGSTIYVKGGCTITRVEEADTYYRCYFDNKDGEEFSGFVVGDQARCQRYDKSYQNVIKYYWRLVVGVGDDYVDLSKTDSDGTGLPTEGDDIAQLGNRTDKTRQSAVVISPDSGGSVVIWAGINSFDLSEKNMIGMGVDASTGEAYFYGYGNMYMGDRNQTSFMRFTKNNGVEICGSLAVGTKLGDGRDLKEAIDSATPEGYQEFVDAVTKSLGDLQNQVDGAVDSFFLDYGPTLTNYPASEWTTDAQKEAHLGDTFTNNTTGDSWRWGLVNGSYQWIYIEDTATKKALAEASKAKETADGKMRVFTTTPYPPYQIGDLWTDGTDLYKCKTKKDSGTYSKDDWEKATKYTGDEALDAFISGTFKNSISNLEEQIDGKIDTWYQTSDPSTSWTTNELKSAHVGDMWYHTTNKELKYYSSNYSWVKVEDKDTIAAYETASKAKDTADNKRRVFTTTPTTPYDKGDLWAGGSGQPLKRCVNSRSSGSYNSNDWDDADNSNARITSLTNSYNTEVPALKVDLDKVKQQTDKEYTLWFGDYIPTATNKPASDWTTDALKAEHEEDLFYNTSAVSGEGGRGYRYLNGAWKEITDHDTLAALEQLAALQNRVSDFDYLKEAFKDDETLVSGGLVMSSLVGVRNALNEMEAFLNGSDFAKDETHGKLLLAGGIPSGVYSIEKRAKSALTRIYEDGFLFTENMKAKGAILEAIHVLSAVIEGDLILGDSHIMSIQSTDGAYPAIVWDTNLLKLGLEQINGNVSGFIQLGDLYHRNTMIRPNSVDVSAAQESQDHPYRNQTHIEPGLIQLFSKNHYPTPVDIKVNENGKLVIYSPSWLTESEATTGQVFKDNSGYLKIKG